MGGAPLRLLLDTHVWIWSVLATERLTRRVVRALESPENELWLSPISTWELLLLAERGRLVLNAGVDSWLAEALEKLPTREAAITHEIARESRRVRLAHDDPADRFLAASAKVLDLTLVTADERLFKTPGLSVLANR